jgi:hypothetical protein
MKQRFNFTSRKLIKDHEFMSFIRKNGNRLEGKIEISEDLIQEIQKVEAELFVLEIQAFRMGYTLRGCF